MSLKQKAVKGVVWTAAQNWGTQAVSLVIFFVLARLLGPADFGLVALANVFLAFMQIFLAEGFAKALIQRQQITQTHLDTVFWLNFGVSILLCGATLLGAPWIAGLFESPELAPVLRWFSVLFLITSFSTVQQAVLEREFEFRAMAIRSLIAICLSGLVGVGMALAGLGVWSLVGQQLTYELVAAIVLWRLSDWRPGLAVGLKPLRELWNFGAMTFGFNAITFVHTRADDLLIGYFLDATALGYYSLAYRILTIMTYLLVNTSNQVALPTFSRLQDDLEQFRRAYYRVVQLTSLVAFPTFVGVALLAEPLILVIFGDQWLPTVPVLQLLSLAGIIRSITFFKSSVLLALDKPHWRLAYGAFDMVLNVVAFAIAVRWGIVAVAFAYFMRAYLVFPIGQWLVARLIHLPWLTYLRQFVAPVLSTVAMTAAILALQSLLGDSLPPLALIVVSTIAGAAVYSLSIVVFAPDLYQELRRLARLALGSA
ncbi:MAG: MOP flippase family protein [Nodosilinea sp.]